MQNSWTSSVLSWLSNSPRIKKKAQEKKTNLQEKREKKVLNINNYVKKNISFADMVSNRNSNTTILSPPEHTSSSQETTSPMSSINDLINMFKTQVMSILQKQQEQINKLTQVIEKNEKKTDYVLNIIDSIYSNNGQP